MVEKRKLSTRGRVESASKKQRPQTPPDPPSPAADPTPEPLPTRVKEGKPIPTLEEPQAEALPSREYQSVAER
jgi:hypothetical protein